VKKEVKKQKIKAHAKTKAKKLQADAEYAPSNTAELTQAPSPPPHSLYQSASHLPKPPGEDPDFEIAYEFTQSSVSHHMADLFRESPANELTQSTEEESTAEAPKAEGDDSVADVVSQPRDADAEAVDDEIAYVTAVTPTGEHQVALKVPTADEDDIDNEEVAWEADFA